MLLNYLLCWPLFLAHRTEFQQKHKVKFFIITLVQIAQGKQLIFMIMQCLPCLRLPICIFMFPSFLPIPSPTSVDWVDFISSDKGVFAKLKCSSVSLFLPCNEWTLAKEDSRWERWPIFVLYQFVLKRVKPSLYSFFFSFYIQIFIVCGFFKVWLKNLNQENCLWGDKR